MREATFTPGPWEVFPEEADRSYIRVRGTRLGMRFKVANVLLPEYAAPPNFETAETRANARLIAAAPEHHEAVKASLMVLCTLEKANDWHPNMEKDIAFAINACRAALSKATGEQS